MRAAPCGEIFGSSIDAESHRLHCGECAGIEEQDGHPTLTVQPGGLSGWVASLSDGTVAVFTTFGHRAKPRPAKGAPSPIPGNTLEEFLTNYARKVLP